MTGLTYALILMGCSDDMSTCTEVARDKQLSTTLRECEKSQEDALQSEIALEIDYPVVAAKCIRGGEKFAQTGARYIGQ
mgnify:CR=1 FL=1